MRLASATSNGASPLSDCARLYKEGFRHARAAAFEILGCEFDADEAAQRVVVRHFRRGLSALEVGHPMRYFRKAGHREALMLLREGVRSSTLFDPVAMAHFKDPRRNPLDQCIQEAEKAHLRRCILLLPPRCSAVMSLVLSGHTRREIAECLGIRIKAVEKQITRGYRNLRKMYAGADIDRGRH